MTEDSFSTSPRRRYQTVGGRSSLCLWILFLLIRTNGSATEETTDNNTVEKGANNGKGGAHSRQKRLLWITADGRLALPPGTTLVISPSLSLPFVRYPPEGFASNMTISLPFTINFDKLGLTDNENPYGVLPPLLARSMGEEVGNVLGQYVMRMMNHKRKRRSLMDETQPTMPEEYAHAFHGGERALMYTLAEQFLENLGMNGRACLLRAICEVHAHPLQRFGVVGEMLKLFLTASRSPYSKFIPEYVEAENAGNGKSGPAECWPYLKDCPKSLFQTKHNKYSKEHISNDISEDDNEIYHKESPEVTYDPSLLKM